MIELQEVTKNFGTVRAVDKISLRIETGETLALLGTSGCGKTTTLRMINRLIEPSSGKILINGANIHTQSPVELRRRMGYVIQHSGLFPHYTVAENIAIVPQLIRMEQSRMRHRVRELMDKLSISWSEYASKYPAELSGGQQQRVGLARALAADPPILLMDEPFGALDPITRRNIQQEFLQLEELKEKTTIIVTHDITEAFLLADRICLLDQGLIQQLGTPIDLLLKPSNDFVRSFLAGKKVQLQLQALRLNQILDFFPTQLVNDAELIFFPPESSVMHALKTLVAHSHGRYHGMTIWQEQKRYFDLKMLFDSFHKSVNP